MQTVRLSVDASEQSASLPGIFNPQENPQLPTECEAGLGAKLL